MISLINPQFIVYDENPNDCILIIQPILIGNS
jgi:hypothetical protein